MFDVGCVTCSARAQRVILIADNSGILVIEKYQKCYHVLDLFSHDIFAKPRSKMTMVSSFSSQHDTGLCALNVVP